MFLFLGFSLPLNSLAQNSKGQLKKRSKNADKRKDQQIKEDAQYAEYSKEIHMSHQTKEVRKRMKKNKKRARRQNHNKREFFLVRFFKKKFKH